MITDRLRISTQLLAVRMLAVSFILLAGYLLIDAVTPNPDVILGLRVLQASASIVVMYVYWPDVWDAFLAPRPVKGDYLTVGIFLGQLANTCQAVFIVIYRLAHSPQWLANSDINGIWILVGVVASALHILAPGAYEGSTGGMIPRRNRRAMGFGIGGAFATAMALLTLRPDIGPFVETLRPYLDDWFKTGRTTLHLWGSVA